MYKLAVSSLFAIAGAVFLTTTIAAWFQLRAASDWPLTTGTVESVTTSSSQSAPRGGFVYARSLIYSYTVDELPYEGHREYFGFRVASNHNPLPNYNSGRQVEVYYNPESPELSVLDPHSYRGIVLPLALSVGLLGFAALGFRSVR